MIWSVGFSKSKDFETFLGGGRGREGILSQYDKNDAHRLIRPLWENSFEGKLHQQSPSPISIGIGIGIGRLPS